ncbi:hypothetical protein Hanom_Chr10g00929381 [Helianthus anomalus]
MEKFNDRIAWLRIVGVPIIAWEREVFNEISSTFGVVILPSKAGVRDCNLAYEIVGILTNMGRTLNEEVTITWHGKEYRVWIKEIMEDWVLDFLIGSMGGPKRYQSMNTGDLDAGKNVRDETMGNSDEGGMAGEDEESPIEFEQSCMGNVRSMDENNEKTAQSSTKVVSSNVVPEIRKAYHSVFNACGPSDQ